jgi:hypothetical protein
VSVGVEFPIVSTLLAPLSPSRQQLPGTGKGNCEE